MIELLSPSQNKECAIAAIKYGADAVYIGGSCFGARKNAGNTLSDISEVIEFAHKFNAKVYITLNTILKDEELQQAQKLIYDFYNCGADALIIQDMGLLELALPPIPLHASTQCNNISAEKVLFLEKVGFQRVILARELSLKQIQEIKQKTNVELETFIHGALCVSFSGQCYMSYANGKRSANRGECAQPCRKKYSLKDENGTFIAKDKYLLSLKDFNASEYIKTLMDIGVTSFKIEGRLKDVNYVKNITAYYRQLIDNYGGEKTSSGKIFYDFIPNPSKSFNRGFCDYFLEKRKMCANFSSPKSIGEKIGTVTECTDKYFKIKGGCINAQDGLFWITNNIAEGCLVNKVIDEKIYPQKFVKIPIGTEVHRNYDFNFEKILTNSKTERKIGVNFIINKSLIKAIDEDNNTVAIDIKKTEIANNQEKMKEIYFSQFNKTGESIFYVNSIIIENELIFLKIAEINQLRRQILSQLIELRLKNYKQKIQPKIKYVNYIENELDFRANIFNKKAEKFYKNCNCIIKEHAVEKTDLLKNKPLMTTKYCLKHAFKLCQSPKELFLTDEKNNSYRLKFDCQNCQMSIYKS